ncbi:MAG: phenylacetate--CoA ligase family protein [Deltaproteobacteria bacterium]|nr:phenylacetate--CoA ligase family protein [Deltaproteobacteria bacterium]
MKKRSERIYPDEQETWPEERLKRYQFRRIKRVLRHAQENLPFYSRRFGAANVDPESVANLEDFSKLPTFNKGDVLREISEKESFATGMEALDPSEPAVLCMTSGTLGTAFLYLPRKWRSLRGDSLARAYRWAGLRSGMRMLMAAPAWHSLAVQETRVVERLGVTCVIPWGTFLPRFSVNFLAALKDIRPAFVSIFLPMLYALLAECRRAEVSPREAFSSVEYLLVVGAPMTPTSRRHLREEIRVRDIFEGLGNPEGLTAMECSYHRGHHVFMDCCYVEIIDPKSGAPAPAGTRGSVVLTSLIPEGSVYIRYDSEDIGEMLPGRCECGRTWPLLEIYDRRANTVQVAGKEIVPYDVRLCLDEVAELRGFPFAVIRARNEMASLSMVIQRPPVEELQQVEARLMSLLSERLGIESNLKWTQHLPERWKGVAVIEERDWEVARV